MTPEALEAAAKAAEDWDTQYLCAHNWFMGETPESFDSNYLIPKDYYIADG